MTFEIVPVVPSREMCKVVALYLDQKWLRRKIAARIARNFAVKRCPDLIFGAGSDPA
jgi:hypothetical protein